MASTTWALIRALTGSMIVGSVTTVSTRAVKRSVLNATWCAQTATVDTTTERHARTKTTASSARPPRDSGPLAGLAGGTGVNIWGSGTAGVAGLLAASIPSSSRIRRNDLQQ